MPDLKLCDQRKALLGAGGHLLVLGGPGSGKTTIALVKGAPRLRTALSRRNKRFCSSASRARRSRGEGRSRHRVAARNGDGGRSSRRASNAATSR
jgi:DNA helicase II / ATP-dependent DNA helicase PcrA